MLMLVNKYDSSYLVIYVLKCNGHLHQTHRTKTF